MNDKILVPVDFTPAAENALRLACMIAGKRNMGICILHVEQDKTSKEPELKALADKVARE